MPGPIQAGLRGSPPRAEPSPRTIARPVKRALGIKLFGLIADRLESAAKRRDMTVEELAEAIVTGTVARGSITAALKLHHDYRIAQRALDFSLSHRNKIQRDRAKAREKRDQENTACAGGMEAI